jgi:hypothetical protein
MSRERPIKLKDGKLKQFSNTDKLPNDDAIEEIQIVLSKLIKCLIENDIEIDDEEVIVFLNKYS